LLKGTYNETHSLTDLSSWIYPRTKLVNELIHRLHYYHIIRVRGTPASGKTTVMNLVVNQLLENYGKEKPIHVLTDWNESKVDGKGGWGAYLKHKTGVHGNQWLTYPAYLVIDEAQVSYWDAELWTDFFKRIVPLVSPYILLFTSYGSPGRGFVGFSEKRHMQTPLIFAPEQQISLRADENIRYYDPWRADLLLTPVGLLLDQDEALEVVTLITKHMQPRPSLTEDLKKGLALFSGGHIGLLESLLRALHGVSVSIPTLLVPGIEFSSHMKLSIGYL
jgi:hypothetical protein